MALVVLRAQDDAGGPPPSADEPMLPAAEITVSEVTVTATRVETPIDRTGRVIHVVTADEIARMPLTSTDELLRYVSGVEVQSRMGFGVQSDIGPYAASANQVTVWNQSTGAGSFGSRETRGFPRFMCGPRIVWFVPNRSLRCDWDRARPFNGRSL